MKSVKYLIFLIGILYSQVSIDLPANFSEIDFTPAKLSVSNAGIYVLDIENRQIAFIANDGGVLYSGGYGIENDAFIDPIDILTSKLGVWIVDGSENNLISFDHKLNYLYTIEFDEIYPNLCGIDDWGNIYLLSSLEEKIYKIDNINPTLNEFIDLTIYSSDIENAKDIFISENGTITLLTEKFIFNFNRLGRLFSKIEIDDNFNFAYQIKNDLILIEDNNQLFNLNENEKTQIPVDHKILDIFIHNTKLYFLLENKIRVVNAKLE